MWKRRLYVNLVLDLDDAIVHLTVHEITSEEENIAGLKISACKY